MNYFYLKKRITELVDEWNVPGVSVGILDGRGHNEIISIGKRDIDNNNNFNEDTIIPIGCCTKAFTSLAIGLLSERKELCFDDPVKKHLPHISLCSKLLTNNVTIKDILCMRTGIHMDEIIYKNSNYSCEDILEKTKYLKPYAGFREYFVYDIYLYNFLKKIIENISHVTWENFILNEIAYPIGLHNIMFASDYINKTNHAIGYYQKDTFLFETQKECNINCIMPSAGIDMNAKDCMKWMEFLLYGKNLISNDVFSEIFKPYVFSKAKPAYKELLYQSYALGWFNEPYKGNNVFYHEGNAHGYSCLIGILPDMKIGISVFINKDKCLLTRTIFYTLIDILLNLEQTNWSKRFMREAIIKKTWLNNCINPVQAIKYTKHINYGCYFDMVYGELYIYRTNHGELLMKILNSNYSFFSIYNEWYVFNDNDDFVFLKYNNNSNSVNIKFSINSKEIEFTKK